MKSPLKTSLRMQTLMNIKVITYITSNKQLLHI
ncbi:MAG: hypothetical protein RIT22_199 [Bacteroidota bacterium]